MLILDCQTIASTYSSVGKILGLTRKQIDMILDEMEPGMEYAAVANRVRKHAQRDASFVGIKWFHFTRVAPTRNFAEGLLPLPAQLENIWSFLFSLRPEEVTRERWSRFRDELNHHRCHEAELYRTKTVSPDHMGPFGWLSKRTAVEGGRRSQYLQAPEIIEDICICFERAFGFNLLAAFKRATQPHIVKFLRRHPDPRQLNHAIGYLYNCRIQKTDAEISAATFNAFGKPIPREDIISVEPLDVPHSEEAQQLDSSDLREIHQVWEQFNGNTDAWHC